MDLAALSRVAVSITDSVVDTRECARVLLQDFLVFTANDRAILDFTA